MARLEHDRGMEALGLHPLIEMMERMVGLVDVEADVHETRVDLVAAQVVAECLEQRGAVVVEQRLHGLQLLSPPCHGTGRAGIEVRALPGDQVGVVGFGHVVSPRSQMRAWIWPSSLSRCQAA
jgi:hypothetical protein